MEKEKNIIKEARIKTFIVLSLSSLTSIIIPLIISLLIPGIKQNLCSVINAFFIKGSFATMVFSHMIAFITYMLDDVDFFYNPKFWKYTAKNIKGEYLLLFLAAIILMLLAVLTQVSAIVNESGKSYEIGIIIMSVLLFVFDIIFNYRFILKKESLKEDKYNLTVVANELEKSQEKIAKDSQNISEFSGGKL